MAETSKNATYKYFNGKDYETINFKTTATQVVEDDNHKFVKKSDITRWDGKASTAVATQSTLGLMSAADKKKLDGIAVEANKYVPPSSYSASIIVQDATHRFVTDTERSTWNGKANNVAATQSAWGLMSAADKKKLDGIESTIKTMVLNNFYPVGSIYMSVSSTNPGKTMGGTWAAWGSGMVPVGVNTNDSSFSKVEQRGGEKTHKLSVNEMPSHTHDMEMIVGQNYVIPNNAGTGSMAGSGNVKAHWFTGSVRAAARGGDGAHNNLQPYITCYMWKRTA